MIWLLFACTDAPFEAVQTVVDHECVPCHNPELTRGDLDLWTDLHAAVVDVPSVQSDLLLVEPGDFRYSYLFHKVNGTQSLAAGSGTAMPVGGTLTDGEIDLIARWIDAGARRR